MAEDDTSVRNYVSAVLQSAGYTVLAAENGDVALNLSRNYQERIDTLLTDFNMPGPNGFELAAIVSHERPAISVVVTSGQDLENALPAGCAWHLLPKPFTPAALLGAIVPAA